MLRLTVGTLPVMFIVEQTEAEETVGHRELSTVNTANVKDNRLLIFPLMKSR